MKVAIVTDSHWGIRGDKEVFRNASVSFFQKQFLPFLQKEQIKTVIDLGDIFDRRKFVNFVTLDALKRKYLDPLSEMDVKMELLLGNHDIPYKDTNRINSPILLLDEYENINVHDKPIEMKEYNSLFLPWISPDIKDKSDQLINSTKLPFCMGHLELSGFIMYRGQECHEGMSSDIFRKFKKVLTGHFHHKSNKDNVYYLGSPYQATWADWGDERGFHTFDTVTGELKFYPNPDQMFHKVRWNGRKNTPSANTFCNKYVRLLIDGRKDRGPELDLYLSELQTVGVSNISIDDISQHSIMKDGKDLQVEDLKDTLTILRESISEMKLDDEEEKLLQGMMAELYKEALEIEI